MIYSDDIRACNAIAQASPQGLVRAASFVLATIRQPLEQVPEIMRDFDKLGPESRYAFGFKAKGLDYIKSHSSALFVRAKAAKSDADLLAVFLDVPGLGIVKAGFLCQLYANRIGCIDSHNIKLYDVPLSSLRYNAKLKADTLAEKRQRYVDLCHGLGGSAFLWSTWCDHVAQLRPERWTSGRKVSRFHITCLGG